jgi:hypothetical protein
MFIDMDKNRFASFTLQTTDIGGRPEWELMKRVFMNHTSYEVSMASGECRRRHWQEGQYLKPSMYIIIVDLNIPWKQFKFMGNQWLLHGDSFVKCNQFELFQQTAEAMMHLRFFNQEGPVSIDWKECFSTFPTSLIMDEWFLWPPKSVPEMPFRVEVDTDFGGTRELLLMQFDCLVPYQRDFDDEFVFEIPNSC